MSAAQGIPDGTQTIVIGVAAGVATITLDRPEKLNSFTQQMCDEMAATWAWIREDEEVRAVVLRANGERAFSTGVDVTDPHDRHPNPFVEVDPGRFLGPKANRVWKPVVTAVHGMACGGAFYWINESDVLICSEDAEFFDPHVTYGLTAALEPIGLLHRIPLGEVLRIALFGLDERVTAERQHPRELPGPDDRDSARHKGRLCLNAPRPATLTVGTSPLQPGVARRCPRPAYAA